MIILFQSLVAIIVPTNDVPSLDGGAYRPISQAISYSFVCSDGEFTMTVEQIRNGVPIVIKARYRNRELTAKQRGYISNQTRRLRAVSTVTPHCIAGGGISLWVSGLPKDRLTNQSHMITIEINPRGHVTIVES